MSATSKTAEQCAGATTFSRRYGPWAVVTGASDGIGRAMASRLARSGVNLVLVARRRPLLEALGSQLAAETGVMVRVIEADLSLRDAVGRIDATTADLDVGLLVAAAGFGGAGPLIEAPLALELEMIDVNCRSVVELSAVFGRRLAARGRGGIVLISSLFAFQGVPRAANYAATKAFVQTFAEGLARELAPRGVDLLVSAPGPVRTGFASRADLTMSMADTPEAVAKATLGALGRKTTVRPGFLAKALEASLVALPRWARTRVMSLVMADMTKHRTVSRNVKSAASGGTGQGSRST